MSQWVDVIKESEFKIDERHFAQIGEHRVMVFRLTDGFYAIENLCTHAYFELDDALIKDEQITCPLHGAKFCIKTGEVLSAPAFESLMTFEVRVNQDNMVQVRSSE